MLTSFLTAMTAMILISTLWLAVQRLWLRNFPDNGSGGGDALAGRSGCRGCNCGPTQCERDPARASLNKQPEEGSQHAP